MVRDIQATASRASHLTAQLQAIGRTQSEESVILSPVTLIQSNAEVLERIVGVDIEIMWSLGSDVANIEVDADQFEQMLLNLAINARDAMPSGGRLSIAASNVTLGSTLAKDLGLAKGEYVTISVADTGVGMDEETRLRCFDPLFTTKGAFKGTGMGLAAARRLVEGSGGAIRCTSHPGEGAMFEILLPASREKATALAPVVQISRPRGSATVLVAEDDEELRSLMVQVLQRSGYVILEANSAESALELAKATDTPIDLLVSDVVMEELTGPQLARLLQDDQPGIRVLLISGTADANVVDGLIDDTAAFMAKPFKPSQLVDQVHDLLVRRGVR
jgi:CheY-like chemotaxis protein